jgi:hypothetical protein
MNHFNEVTGGPRLHLAIFAHYFLETVENGGATTSQPPRCPLYRVEAPITDHLRDFSTNLEKYKVAQNLPMWEDRNEEDCKYFGNFIPQIEIIILTV